MAFLLSPKSGGVTYSIITPNLTVSINDAEAHEYTEAAPGTVKPGDVISTEATTGFVAYYYSADPDAGYIKNVLGTMPYTVEAVSGAVALQMFPHES